MTRQKLLIIEDDPGLRSQMKWCFDDGIEVYLADNQETALAQIEEHSPQVITLDLGLPPDPGGISEGFKLLKIILECSPRTRVIVVTGREDREHAVRAISHGAMDYYQKPVEAKTLSFVVNRAFRLHKLESDGLGHPRNEPSPVRTLEGIIGESKVMQRICQTIHRIADTNLSTLIQGETGTGKELIAKSLHNLSTRAGKPFTAINCAAIPAALLESELFGFERGAFTGANQQKKGKIELANGGTLFLDEIGDMPLELQAKLLRFLEDLTVERIGGHLKIRVDIRIVSATHQDLEKMIAEKTFREDLYYRISELSVNLPPLRDREADVLLIARHLLQTSAPELNPRVNGFTPDALAALQHHGWPGNIRELNNKLKRAVLLCDGEQISAKDLGLASETPDQNNAFPLGLRTIREKAEKKAIEAALVATGHNMARAARLLDISRPTLYALTEKLEIDKKIPAPDETERG